MEDKTNIIELNIANVIDQPFSSLGEMQVGMNTDVLSDMVTSHNMKVGAIKPNQYVQVIDAKIDKNITVLDVELFEKRMN